MTLVINHRPHPVAVSAAQVALKAQQQIGEDPDPDMLAILEAEERYAREESVSTQKA